MSNEIATVTPSSNFNEYSSVVADSRETRALIYNALSDSTPIAQHFNEVINLVHIIVQQVELEDATGNRVAQPRVTLIDESGKAFHTTSVGAYQDQLTLRRIMGEPHTWEAPLPVQVVEVRLDKGRKTNSIKLV